MTRVELARTLGDGFAERLTALWTEVTESGGAVGFTAADDPELIRSATDAVLAAVAEGQELLFTAHEQERLLGVVFLVPADVPAVQHRGEVRRLMVSPAAQGLGVGGALLNAAVTHAGEIGLRTVSLGVRSGDGLERFYTEHGWTERGRWPGAVHLGDEDYRDEVWFTIDLTGYPQRTSR
ncbi:GNAT family N-acetyltransferase [Sciscionella sediminilitoris]|uniref:GNAT family N-acetyltransferase n=1 Tax=Sciscionella sediminilitoris TaxID=1445613 RepID=UPI000561B081|nr:GNAT family N-acetyltransferase [Sciscionella sp. SE31]